MSLRHLLLVLGLCGPLVAAEATPSTRDAATFSQDVAQLLRQRTGEPVAVQGPLSLRYGAGTLDLRRIFASCRMHPATCDEDVGRFVNGNVEMQQAAHARIDPAALRLIVRQRETIERPESDSAGTHDVQTEPLVANLLAVVVVDTPNSMLFVRGKELASLHMTHDQLFERARANMHAALKPLESVAPPAPNDQMGVVQGGDYELARIATPADWAPLARAQHGTLVIALPAIDIVLYASSTDPQVLKGLSAVSRKQAAAVPNPLAPDLLLQWRGDHWEVLPGY